MCFDEHQDVVKHHLSICILNVSPASPQQTTQDLHARFPKRIKAVLQTVGCYAYIAFYVYSSNFIFFVYTRFMY